MNFTNEWKLQKVEREYNPEYDVPSGPPVTWVEGELLQAVRELQARIKTLEGRIEAMDEALQGVYFRQ